MIYIVAMSTPSLKPSDRHSPSHFTTTHMTVFQAGHFLRFTL